MPLAAYEPFVGPEAIDEIVRLAVKLEGKVVQHVNSTLDGGGVAEILHRMVPLMRQLGIDARWNVIKGRQSFFRTTKKFHNAIQGRPQEIRTREFSTILDPSKGDIDEYLNADFIVIHDPQPISLVSKRTDGQGNWIWRCHIDVSEPPEAVWDFIQDFAIQYDAVIFTAPAFAQHLPVPQHFIAPSIDPLSTKNRDLPQHEIDGVLDRLGIPRDKPIITQISRFDHFKDPVGVIRVFRELRAEVDCRLVLAGGTASDDPESDEVVADVLAQAAGDNDIHVLLLPPDSDTEINALQRASTVIVQKSLKEGFGLTVTEAMWKRKPVVATTVGGIVLQVKDGYSGVLCSSIEEVVAAVKQILLDPSYAQRLGENARDHVRQNFLITRHLRDYLTLFLSLQ